MSGEVDWVGWPVLAQAALLASQWSSIPGKRFKKGLMVTQGDEVTMIQSIHLLIDYLVIFLSVL